MKFLLILVALCFQSILWAKPKVVGNNSDDYISKRQKDPSVKSRKANPFASGSHYLSLGMGTFFNDKAYKWGADSSKEGVGDIDFAITYRVGEWMDSTDFLFRIDFARYSLTEGNATKMSLLPMATFPDARSGFPLYFGMGAGLGVYFKQIGNESNISLDYQLVAGARFFNVFGSTGLKIESGLKNHVHLLSDGQYNGVFVNVGTVFVF